MVPGGNLTRCTYTPDLLGSPETIAVCSPFVFGTSRHATSSGATVGNLKSADADSIGKIDIDNTTRRTLPGLLMEISFSLRRRRVVRRTRRRRDATVALVSVCTALSCLSAPETRDTKRNRSCRARRAALPPWPHFPSA